MDYEKIYNEALERAKELLLGNEHSNTIRSYFEHIFPELREDERIRKGLIKLLTVASEAYLVESTGIKKDSYLSWLEKQKEPHFTKRNALFDECVAKCDPAIMKKVSDKVDEMLGKEQKQTDLPAGFYFIDLDGKKYYSKEFRYGDMKLKVVEQKPAWSEEDEKIRRNLMSLLADMRGDRITEETYQKYYPWLSALRPGWKPTEEQMEALKKVAYNLIGSGTETDIHLVQLYEQLKKL